MQNQHNTTAVIAPQGTTAHSNASDCIAVGGIRMLTTAPHVSLMHCNRSASKGHNTISHTESPTSLCGAYISNGIRLLCDAVHDRRLRRAGERDLRIDRS